MVILGTQYAGEMKKGIFTVMHYLMPKRGILSLHSGCNVGKNDDVTLFFGLSGIPSFYMSSSLLMTSLCQGHILQEHGVFMMLCWQRTCCVCTCCVCKLKFVQFRSVFTVPVTLHNT